MKHFQTHIHHFEWLIWLLLFGAWVTAPVPSRWKHRWPSPCSPSLAARHGAKNAAGEAIGLSQPEWACDPWKFGWEMMGSYRAMESNNMIPYDFQFGTGNSNDMGIPTLKKKEY